MQTRPSTPSRSALVRRGLDHPILDSDGHHVEYQPAVFDILARVAGSAMVDRYRKWVEENSLFAWYAMSPAEREDARIVRPPWWGIPMEDVRDRATVMFPKLLHERMEELGLDFSVIYPTWGLMVGNVDDAEIRRAACRAMNVYSAEVFAPYSDRMTPVAVIPTVTPEEAIEELDFAIGELGLKSVVMNGYAVRPIPAAERLGVNAARFGFWLDTFGLDSAYDYDPLWRRCVELGVNPTFHTGGMGWGSRNSISNYVFNHIGHFAAAGDATCKSLFLGGVTRRFPTLRFAFLEGGVAWACSLFSDLIGHWEKRNPDAIERYNPARLDQPAFDRFFERYAEPAFRTSAGPLATATGGVTNAVQEEKVDEYGPCRIERVEDFLELFVRPFYFGCEADDPTNAWAFAARVNPLGARLQALFSSDIGHWDVPVLADVAWEAQEGVRDGLIEPRDFEDFVFRHPARFWTNGNPDFFAGTAVEAAVRALD
ncbi:MAG: amidohydrolase family protein [Spirochaetaceae bacterium]|nr:amidohydrolase family protein [Myxococcales bacterium]MCB9726755.1 amidohydrolase family protein [Spirochaetaceae bacterium]HPG24049.1 amidohydrolase family protein [Myxococcota bacterium]